MSQEAFEAAITRMATNHEFTAAVQQDPDTALAGLDLTAEERTTLEGLTHDGGSGPTRLAQRSSKSALFFGTGLHDAAAAPAHHAAAHTAGPATHAAAQATGASAGDQVVTWVTSMDHPGFEEEEEEAQALEAELLGGAGQEPDAPTPAGGVPPV